MFINIRACNSYSFISTTWKKIDINNDQVLKGNYVMEIKKKKHFHDLMIDTLLRGMKLLVPREGATKIVFTNIVHI